MTPISRHLTLEQLTRTSQPIPNELQQVLRYGRIHTPAQIRADLEHTARTLMDPLIDQFGPGRIDSGYRCPAVNAAPAVGGATNSAHLVGLAVDWQPGVSIREVMLWAAAARLPYDRLIVEERGQTTWLHVQAPQDGPGEPVRALYVSPRGGVYTALALRDLTELRV